LASCCNIQFGCRRSAKIEIICIIIDGGIEIPAIQQATVINTADILLLIVAEDAGIEDLVFQSTLITIYLIKSRQTLKRTGVPGREIIKKMKLKSV